MTSRLRVLLVGNYAKDEQYSMLGFGNCLAHGLLLHNIETRSIAPIKKVWRPKGKLDKWAGYADKYVLFPRRLRQAARNVDVVHVIDQGNGIYFEHLRSTPNLVTCHDLLAIRSALGELPYWQTGRSGRIYQAAILRGLKKAKFVACSSTATKRDADRLLKLPSNIVKVLRLGPFEQWNECRGAEPPEACRTAGLVRDSSFALQIGGSIAYKNCMGAVETYAAMASIGCCAPSKLVIVGRELSAKVRSRIKELGIGDKVLQLMGLSGTDLEWLYSNAWGLLMTSYDEGFGMPMIEAQSCGCPVYATDKQPMTEVGGDGAVYIEISDPSKAAERIMESRSLLVEQKLRGYENIKSFTTAAMVAEYAGLYKNLSAS